jgi:hypothetical protein
MSIRVSALGTELLLILLSIVIIVIKLTVVHLECARVLLHLELFVDIEQRDIVGRAGWFLNGGEIGALPPLVEFLAKGIGLRLNKTELAGGNNTVAALRLDYRDGRIDDRTLRRATDSCEILQ